MDNQSGLLEDNKHNNLKILDTKLIIVFSTMPNQLKSLQVTRIPKTEASFRCIVLRPQISQLDKNLTFRNRLVFKMVAQRFMERGNFSHLNHPS